MSNIDCLFFWEWTKCSSCRYSFEEIVNEITDEIIDENNDVQTESNIDSFITMLCCEYTCDDNWFGVLDQCLQDPDSNINPQNITANKIEKTCRWTSHCPVNQRDKERYGIVNQDFSRRVDSG